MEARVSWIFLAVAPAAALVVMGLANGGFSPVAGSWIAISFAWASLIAILWLDVSLSRMALISLGGLLLLELATAASMAWTSDQTAGAQEVERNLAYLAAGLAGALLATLRPHVLRGSVLIAAAALSVYGAVVHLVPDVFGLYSQTTVPGREYYPIGYWNSQALLAVVAILLLADEAINGSARTWRCLAAASIPWAAVTCIFTLSRGAEIALAFGLAVWVVLTPGRLRTSVWLFFLGIFGGVAAWRADRAGSLYGASYTIHSSGDGHALALQLAALSAVLAVGTRALATHERRVAVPAVVRYVYTGVLVLLAVAALGGATDRYGAPTKWPKQAYDSFTAPPSTATDASRLLTFSLNLRNLLWSVAWKDAQVHPVQGQGAGSYGVAWYRHRTVPSDTSYAHSLYMQTLSETGVVGLAALIVGLGTALVAGVRARRVPHAAAVMGAYCAALLHTGVDWDWLIPAVTIPVLWCCFWLTAADPKARLVRVTGVSRGILMGGSALVIVLGVLGLIGNRQLSQSHDAAQNGNYAQALSDARDAARWQPWSYLPLLQEGLASQTLGHRAEAIAAYREATEKGPNDWQTWLALSSVAPGPERAAALRKAHSLNPLSAVIASNCLGRPVQVYDPPRVLRHACDGV